MENVIHKGFGRSKNSPSGVWIARNAARPHAALLFMDFLLSLEAQQMIAGFGRMPSRSDVKLKYDVGERKVHTLSQQWSGKKFEEVNRLLYQLLR